jgi:hypothetical protein
MRNPFRGIVVYFHMKLLFAFCVAAFTLSLNAQSLRTDTVKPGYYIPFDSNFASCKVAITPKGKTTTFKNTTGNRISDSLVIEIGKLERGSVVAYTEVTILKNGSFEKSNSVRYVIGSRNSVFAQRDPSLPDTLSAAEIGSLVLEKAVTSFTVSFIDGDAYVEYALTGNGICCEPREKILALKSGTKVYIERITCLAGDGSVKLLPNRTYVVK